MALIRLRMIHNLLDTQEWMPECVLIITRYLWVHMQIIPRPPILLRKAGIYKYSPNHLSFKFLFAGPYIHWGQGIHAGMDQSLLCQRGFS